MKKIRLEAEALRVESFETDALPAAAGTVEAREAAPGATSKPPNPCYCTEFGPTCPRCQ